MSRKYQKYQKQQQQNHQSSYNNQRRNQQYDQNNNNQSDDNHYNRRNVLNRLGPRFRNRTGDVTANNRSYNNNHRSNNNNHRSNNNNNNNNNFGNEEQFFKITIPNGGRYEQPYIMRLLRENLDDMDDPTTFYNFYRSQNDCSFFVNSRVKADSLRGLSRRIQTDKGHRLTILATSSRPPTNHIDEEFLTLLKNAILSRYDTQTNVLNLSRFRDCETFKQNGIFLMLNRTNMLVRVIEVIKNHLSNVIAINLSDNRLTTLSPLNELSKLYQLKGLDLSKNKIPNIQELDHIKNLDLIELVLEGNPMVQKYESTIAYISSIRKLFKNLKTLDKEDLPDQIGFDVGVQENIPETKISFIPDENLKNFITNFIKEYYRMYDSEDRVALMMAYHECATFSMSVANNNMSYKPNDIVLKESHNLLRVKDENLWVKMVRTSNVEIVSLLKNLPVTKHLLDSFQVDVPFFTDQFINVVVNGLFQETLKTNNPLRSFCRTFFLIPQNNGFVIVNEMFLISSVSMKQANEFKHLIQSSTTNNKTDGIMKEDFHLNPSSSKNLYQESSVSSSMMTISNSTGGDGMMVNNQREEIIRQFREATKMNRAFSLQCLEENGFDAAKAYEVFTKLSQANAIPPEAFRD